MEATRDCGNCFYSGQCDGSRVCEYYDPVVPEEYPDDITEEKRYDFYKEWFEYLKDFNN